MGHRVTEKLALATCLAAAACPGGSSDPPRPDAGPPPVYTIELSPDELRLSFVVTAEIAATVRNLTSGNVVPLEIEWELDPDLQTTGGMFTVHDGGVTVQTGYDVGTFTIVARLATDPSVSATATIEVFVPGPDWREGPAGGIDSLDWSGDGTRLLIGTSWGSRLHDAATLRPVGPLLDAQGVPALISNDEVVGVRWHVDTPVARYSATTGQLLASYGPAVPVQGPGAFAAVLGDGGILVAGDATMGEPMLYHFDPQTGARVDTYGGPNRITRLITRGTQFAVATAPGTVGSFTIWETNADPPGGTFFPKMTMTSGPITNLQWTGDGTRIFMVSSKSGTFPDYIGGYAAIYQPPAPFGTETVIYDGPDRRYLQTGAMSPDAQRLVLATEYGNVRLLDAGATVWSIDLRPPVRSLRWSPTDDRIAIMYAHDVVAILDGATGATLVPPARFSLGLSALAASGDRLVTAGRDRALHMWNPTTGALEEMIPYDVDTVTALAWDPSGTLLAVADRFGTIGIFDPVARAEVRRFLVDPLMVDHATSLVWSADGSQLLAGLVSATTILDAVTGAPVLTTACSHAPSGAVFVARRADGSIVSGGATEVRICSGTDGSLVSTIDIGTEIVHGEVSPDGSLVAVAASFGDAGVYDLAGGARVLDFADAAFAVAFSPDGARLASVNQPTEVRVWDVATGARTKTMRFPFAPSRIERMIWTAQGLYTCADELARWSPD